MVEVKWQTRSEACSQVCVAVGRMTAAAAAAGLKGWGLGAAAAAAAVAVERSESQCGIHLDSDMAEMGRGAVGIEADESTGTVAGQNGADDEVRALTQAAGHKESLDERWQSRSDLG